ncbi:hypothetical protein GYMLUDRAFT_69959 [Collybiopsis luxurians FD-317 M1]|nr:hypothetical protein GYMLUDRAFT_69959 [Collybiopsis luxurians FD-317 M1]
MSLPFDVFVLILEHLPLPYACRPRIQTQSLNKDIDSSELNALFNCSLANRELNRAAGKVLYRSVRLHFRYPNIGNINFASRFHQSESDASGSSWKAWNGELAYDIGGVGQDDEKDYGLPHEPHPFLSVLLHRSLNPIHTYVQHLHVTGHLSTLPPGLTSNRLPDLLADAIRLLTSGSEVRLQSLRFTPEQCHPETFTKSLRVLSELAESYEKSEDLESCLHELHLNQFAFDDADKVGLLTRIGSKRGLRLRKLTLENPTRVLLQRLVGSTDESNDAKTETRTDAKEGWLYRLQHDLLELHFIVGAI